MLAKSLGREEVKIGSIIIPQEIFFAGGENAYTQYITLFDHQDDDEYDGEMGENDEEAPRVLFGFRFISELK